MLDIGGNYACLAVIVTFGLNYEDVNKSYLNVTKISI